MDKPSRVGYGLHRRNTQPAKSARYWSASTCFYTLDVHKHLADIPDLIFALLRAPTCSRLPSAGAKIKEPARTVEVVAFLRYCLFTTRPVDPYGAAPDRRSVASGCRCPCYRQLGRNVQNAARRTCCLLSAQGGADAELRARPEALITETQKRKTTEQGLPGPRGID